MGILLALAGLALPSITNWSSRHSDGAMADDLQSSLDIARSIAMERAVVVSVRVSKNPSGGTSLVAAWEREATQPQEEASEQRRTLLLLGTEYRLQRMELDAAPKREERDRPAEPEVEEEALTAWTVLPDGTVRSRERVELFAADGRRGEVKVSGWSGTVSVGALVLPDKEGTTKEEEPEAAPESTGEPEAPAKEETP